jgi:preprotein translocase subunit SecG
MVENPGRRERTYAPCCPLAGRNSEKLSRQTGCDEEHPMMDILMLVLAAAFFALAIGYTYVCERL